jgi:hypothetical protein
MVLVNENSEPAQIKKTMSLTPGSLSQVSMVLKA